MYKNVLLWIRVFDHWSKNLIYMGRVWIPSMSRETHGSPGSITGLSWSFEWLYPFGIPYWIFECLSEFFASEVFILWGGPLDSKTGQATLIDRNKVYFLVPKLAVWPLKYVFNCNFLTISADFTWFFYTFLTTSADFTFVTNIRLTLIKN